MTTDLQIVKSNHLIEASYRLSIAEQRVVLACIAQVRRDQPVTDSVLYSVSAAEIAELSGTDPKTAYRDLSAAAARLFDRRVTILREPDGSDRIVRKRLTRWVQTVDYIDSEGRVELRVGTDMIPYLSTLSANFTRYALTDVAKMTSAYGIRLYELLVQWGKGSREISVDQLRHFLQLEERYPAIKDLKRRVLEPAVEQINIHSPLFVIWEQRKTGKKITHIKFTFTQKKPHSDTGQKTKNPKLLTESEIAKKALPGESWEAARARLKQISLKFE